MKFYWEGSFFVVMFEKNVIFLLIFIYKIKLNMYLNEWWRVWNNKKKYVEYWIRRWNGGLD